MSRKPTPNIDYTSRDYEAFRSLLIQKLQEKMPEYTDTSETDAGIVILEALANGLDIMSLYADLTANDVLLPTTQDRRLAVLISKCLGYTPYNQTASEYQQVFVLNKKRDLGTVIPKGTVVKTKKSADLATIKYETMADLIIPAGSLGDEKEDGKYKYSVRIQQGTSVKQDVIGTSTGAPLQTFNLNFTNVLVDTLELYVDEGEGAVRWKLVDSFLDYNENSKVFIVTVDEFDVCTVEFGNGLKGKIPTAYPNGIVANYRIGGGEAGNVNANIITELDTGIAYVERTFNLDPDVLGHEKESLESIKENAPASYRSRDRLVTLTDYEDLLRINYYDFLALKAEKDSINKKLAHIYYMMRIDYEMTEELQASIADFIEQRSMIGTAYDLIPYVEQPVNLTARLIVDDDYDKNQVKLDVEMYLDGVVFSYGELRFGDTIIKSDVENEVKDTFKDNGLISFRISSPTDDIIRPTAIKNVLTKGTITINTFYISEV